MFMPYLKLIIAFQIYFHEGPYLPYDPPHRKTPLKANYLILKLHRYLYKQEKKDRDLMQIRVNHYHFPLETHKSIGPKSNSRCNQIH